MLDLSRLMTVRYKAGGRTLKGMDCFGLIKWIYKNKLGINLPEFDNLATTNFKNINNIVLQNKNKFIRLDQPEPYCIVAFAIYKPYVSHMGMILEDRLHFIHIYKDIGVAINSICEPKWADRIDGYYRWQQ